MLKNYYPVVIVGAGPVGLTATNLLGIYGIETLLIERNDALMDMPRAILLDDEGLRTMQAAGLDRIILPSTLKAQGIRYYDENGIVFAEVGAGGEEFGFPRRNYIHQPDLEQQLLSGIHRFPNVEVAFTTDLIDFHQDPEQVVLTVRTSTGLSHKIRCDQLLAAEGANSPTRQALGLKMVGDSYLEDWLVIDTANDPDQEPISKFFCNTTRPFVSIPAPNGGRRYEFQFLTGETAEEMAKEETIRRLLRPIRDTSPENIIRIAIYTFQARVIEQWSKGRIHFLGDAAHLTPPFAGQGMNAGLRDAHNLSWKIAAHLNGTVSAPGLNSYGAERAGPALSMVQLAVAMGDIVMPRDQDGIAFRRAVMRQLNRFPEAKDFIVAMKFKPQPRYQQGLFLDLGGQPFAGSLVGCMVPQPPVQRVDGGPTRLDDEIGPGFALFVQNPECRAFLKEKLHLMWPHLAPQAIYLGDETNFSFGSTIIDLCPEPGPALQALRAHRDQILLIRPDRYVAAAFWPEDMDKAIKKFDQALLAPG